MARHKAKKNSAKVPTAIKIEVMEGEVKALMAMPLEKYIFLPLSLGTLKNELASRVELSASRCKLDQC